MLQYVLQQSREDFFILSKFSEFLSSKKKKITPIPEINLSYSNVMIEMP